MSEIDGEKARAPFVLGALGLVSGALSGLFALSPALIPSHFGEFYLHDPVAPLHAPFVFAAAVGFGLWRYERKDFAALLVVTLFIVGGWFLAINASLQASNLIDAVVRSGSAPTRDQRATLIASLVCGPAGGLVGSALTMLGLALVSPRMRHPRAIAPAILAGTIAGLLLNESAVITTTIASTRYILLFIVWQGAVAAAIGSALARPAPAPPAPINQA